MKITHALLLIVASVIVSLSIQNFVLPKKNLATAPKETAYERVMRTGAIRCGYTPYSIGFMKDPNAGKMSGIYYDIVTRLAENLSLKVDWVEEVGWSGQIEGLNSNRYDMICSPVSLNSGRARSADFSIPLYYSPVHIWAKKDNAGLANDLKSLNNSSVRISTLDGEQTSVFAAQFFPLAQQVSLPQTTPFSDLILQVTTGKADIVFAEPLSIYEFMQNNPDSLRQVTSPDKPLLVVPNIILLPRGEIEFKAMIDNALREMFNSHLIDQIIDKYETHPNSYIRENARR
ncbi:MAG: ABC transporter substrate-binding protein [Alphaproteobacteria bacterium]|nr:ABC transporter substrate-binding protein [Alphaproteobacteria bacterium]